MNMCDHKCHTGRGLNPWVEECRVCRCVNPKYDPTIPVPETFEEIVNWDHPDPLQRPEKYRHLKFKDACMICHGENGGVPGNENIIDGVVMCDYCQVIRHVVGTKVNDPRRSEDTE